VEDWIEWVFGPGFHLFSCFFVISRSFLVVCFLWHEGFAFGARLSCYGCGILGMRRRQIGQGAGWRKWRTACFAPGGWGGVVVGKRRPPLQSHAFEWVRDWVRAIVALHHGIDKVDQPLLHGIRHHDPETNHIPIIISSLSFFSVSFLSSG